MDLIWRLEVFISILKKKKKPFESTNISLKSSKDPTHFEFFEQKLEQLQKSSNSSIDTRRSGEWSALTIQRVILNVIAVASKLNVGVTTHGDGHQFMMLDADTLQQDLKKNGMK